MAAGQKVLLTGASGGIGEAIAMRFLENGADVVLSGTRTEKLEALKAKLATTATGQIFCVQSVLSEEGAAAALVQKATECLGGLDTVINNAGITRDGLLMRMKDADWDDVLRLNLTAVMQICRAAIRGLMSQRRGSIVNISSVVAAKGNPGQCNYVAAKAGLEGFTRSLALESASRGVRANCVAPGFIETPMTAALTDTQKESILKSVPFGRMGKPAEIADATLFLASDAASYITGTTLHVNGGMYCA